MLYDQNATFDWTIDADDYLNNNSAHADKVKAADFIAYVISSLNDYKKYTYVQLKNKAVRHTHFCENLKHSGTADGKRLYKHISEKINERLARQSVQIEPDDILQLAIKGYPNKSSYRAFGYILNNIFHLVYLDPEHKVYSS